MNWACRCLVAIIGVFLFVSLVGAVNEDNPYLGQSVVTSDDITNVLSPMFNSMETKLSDDLKAYSDENFRAFDQAMGYYMNTYAKDVQTKVIVGAVGLNFLVAGLVFYLMNRQMRRLSYESFAQRRKETEDDRKYFIDTLNIIRQRLDYLEEESKKKYDVSLVPMDILDNEMRRRYEYQRSSEMQGFDQQLNQFVNMNGGVQNEWAGSQVQAPNDAMAGYGQAPEPPSSATSSGYGGFEAPRRNGQARFI